MIERPELEYPCLFPIKVFLRPSPDIETRIEELVREALPEAAQMTVKRRRSRSGRYLCMTLTFMARDAGQVRQIGRALRDAEGVLLAI